MHFFLSSPPCSTRCTWLLLWAQSLVWENANNQPRQLWVHTPLREPAEEGTGSTQVDELNVNKRIKLPKIPGRFIMYATC